ncbi:MAG: hypothetical protein LQ337_005217 [Flavoplaca oasis]|nr:MAG: hypothetical protein LQ337_005217 [Flavoplaca oasis]
MSNGPLPTRLILLSDLPSCAHGEKVRFLGCVTRYNASTGTLYLEHAYPASTCVTAAVDVSLLLETLKCTDTQVGEWVNVMGYVQAAEEEKGRKRQGVRHEGEKEKSQQEVRKLQAVMLWSAGGVRVWEYEKALEMRKGMEASAK